MIDKEFDNMKNEWDALDPYLINWTNKKYIENAPWLILLIIKSLSKNDSIYISVGENSSSVIYNEFDRGKRLILAYKSDRNEFTLEFLKAKFNGSNKHYIHILGQEELKIIPARFRKAMHQVANRQKQERISSIILS